MDELERVREMLPEQSPDLETRERARVRMHDVIHPSARRRRHQRTARLTAMSLAFAAVIALFALPVAFRAIFVPDDGATTASTGAGTTGAGTTGAGSTGTAGGQPGSTNSGAAQPTAREILLQAALAVPEDPPRTGDFWRSRTTWRGGPGSKETSQFVEEFWFSPTPGGKVWRGSAGAGEPRIYADKGVYLGEGTPLTYDELQALPTVPETLRGYLVNRAIRGGVAADERSILISGASPILAELPAPAAVRRAMFQILADLPGWTVKGTGQDALGRKGYVITRTARDYRGELLIDPQAGALLSQTGRSVINGKVIKGGTEVFVSRGWTTDKPVPPKR